MPFKKTFCANTFGSLALASALLAAGCQRAPADPHAEHGHEADSTHTAAATPAADMCAEHGVLESMCTKCHPELIAAFQARQDWCAEHGFPESVCPICHPALGGRPANASAISGGAPAGQSVDEGTIPDGAPADRTLLQFRSLDSARDAGLQVVAAEAGRDPAGVRATATIVVDASHRALVHAPAAGVVRAIAADVGASIAAGAPLARIESAAVAESRALLRAARARFDASRAACARESTLHRSDLASAQDELAARQELESARAAVAAASAALEMYGAADAGGGAYFVHSPIAGVVTRRAAVLGSMVNTEEALFEVVDAHALWADLDVPESQAGAVLPGQGVTLRAREHAGRDVRGVVEFVAPAVDEHTRTLRVRARLDSGDARGLRPNSWAEAVIRTGSSARTVLVPRAAIQETRGVMLAFVRIAEDRYEVRRVQVGAGENGLVAVHSGLASGEMVVTTGSFLLKTETIKESIGAGCCDVEAPKRR